MSEKIKPGDLLRNNRSMYIFEVRYRRRDRPWVYRIKHVDSDYARWIVDDLVFTDGKPRKSGFSLIKGEPK